MSTRKEIARTFCDLLEAEVEGLAKALPYTPGAEGMPKRFPVVMMLSDLFVQDDRLTGPATDNVWGWEVRVAVDLHQGYEKAQEQLDDLLVGILTVVRRNTDLNESCLWARLEDPGAVPEFVHDEQKRYAWKALNLRCEVEET